MPQDYCGLWGRPQGVPTPSEILGPADHGCQGRQIPWTPFQRVLWIDTRRPCVPHSLQFGCLCLHPPLGDGGGGNWEGTGGLGMPIRDLAVYFYSGNGLVASTQPERLHRAFNILTGLFYWVGLKTNTRKMVIIAYQPFHAPVRMLVEAY